MKHLLYQGAKRVFSFKQEHKAQKWMMQTNARQRAEECVSARRRGEKAPADATVDHRRGKKRGSSRSHNGAADMKLSLGCP